MTSIAPNLTMARIQSIESYLMSVFKSLWDNFPEKDSVNAVCFNKQSNSEAPFGNYCAILLSECLIQSGIEISKFGGKKCWSHTGKKHMLLASDLANALNKNPPSGFGKVQKIDPNSFQAKLKGKTGVIYFKDYWQRGKESFANRSGDHIDLWNKDEITSSSMLYRSVAEFFGFVSDLNKSKEIWFWEVK